MVPRELLIALATLTALCVATSTAAAVAASSAAAAVTSSSSSSSESIDFDLTGVDYEVFNDMDEDKSDSDVDDFENPRFSVHHRGSNSAGHHRNNNNKRNREVRCFCNQPHCVSQGYMCLGRACFTDLPVLNLIQSAGEEFSFRPEHYSYSGCLEKIPVERPCPPGKLCCDQDLCNHVDNPAMKVRLNKTIQVMLGERRSQLGSGREPSAQEEIPLSSDSWFNLAMVVIPLSGFIILFILASLAIKLLQSMPSQGDKLNGLRMPENTPPLLGPPKLPIV